MVATPHVLLQYLQKGALVTEFHILPLSALKFIQLLKTQLIIHEEKTKEITAVSVVFYVIKNHNLHKR